MAAIETRRYLKAVFLKWFRRGIIMVLTCLPPCWHVMTPADGFCAQRLKLPLFQLAPYPIAELKGNKDILNIKVPAPLRWRIEKALLHFEYVNSETLIPERSQLLVRFNGYPLMQTTLRPDSPSGKIDTEIPGPYLLPDYNDLDFQVTQSYSQGCNDPDAPELWTMLDMKKSYLELDYSLKPLPLSLTAISRYLFDPKNPDMAEVHIALEKLDEPALRLAAVAASTVAMHFDYRPVHFSVSTRLVPGRDNLIIARRPYVQEQLNGAVLPDGNLGLMHLPVGDLETREQWGLVVITGPDDGALERSVLGFSVMTDPLPDNPFALVKELHLPEVTRFTGKNMMIPGQTYTFKGLGFVSQNRSGHKAWAIDVDFRIPTDFLIKTNKAALMSLHLAYGAKMRSDSVLNVFLNGLFTAAIPLDDPTGGNYLGYKIEMPNRLLEPGLNRLTFQPVLTPSVSGDCVYSQTDNLKVTIYDDSELSVPEMDRWAAMPDLEYFFKDGFPLAKWPDWRETTVCLSENSVESAGAALNLVAAICQKNRVCPWGVSFKVGDAPDRDRDLLVVGPLDRLPKGMDKESILTKTIRYPIKGETTGFQRTTDWVTKWVTPKEQPGQGQGSSVVLESTLGRGRLLIDEFESPFRATRSVVLLTAIDARTLADGALALWDPAIQTRISKSLAILDLTADQARISCYQSGSSYHVGEIGTISVLDHLVHEQPWLFFMALVLLLVLLAWILWIFLRRRKRKRLANESDSK